MNCRVASSSNKSIGRRPSQRQKVALLDWLEKNIDVVSDTDVYGIRERDAIWGEIASYLNSLGEAKKNGFKWRKFWMDLRSYTKNKCSCIRQIQQDSSAAAFKKNKTLSSIEKRVLELITPASTYREESAASSEVEIGATVKIEECYSPTFEIEESASPVDNDFCATVKKEENPVESLFLENSFAEFEESSISIPAKVSKRKRSNFTTAETNKKLINIEKEKLKIEKAKLKIKKEKLKVSKHLLTIHKEKKDVLEAILEQITNISCNMHLTS